jgi:hypothetical protein
LIDKNRFIQAAVKRGYLFLPTHPLTTREQTDQGPTHCYHCKVLLSFQTRALGCTECRSYVCRCGRCICDYEAKNCQGQFFRQKTKLPIDREDRVEYIRVFRSFSSS